MLKTNSFNKNTLFKILVNDNSSFLKIQKFLNKHHEFQTYKTLGHPKPKRVQTKHIYPKKSPKVEIESPKHIGDEDIVVEIPVRHLNPFLKEIPKVNRSKELKRKTNLDKRKYTQSLERKEGEASEDIVEPPETKINVVLTPNTPTTKIRISNPEKKKK